MKKTFQQKYKIMENKNEYQKFIDNFPEGILITDQENPNLVTYINLTLRKFLSISDPKNKQQLADGLSQTKFIPYSTVKFEQSIE